MAFPLWATSVPPNTPTVQPPVWKARILFWPQTWVFCVYCILVSWQSFTLNVCCDFQQYLPRNSGRRTSADCQGVLLLLHFSNQFIFSILRLLHHPKQPQFSATSFSLMTFLLISLRKHSHRMSMCTFPSVFPPAYDQSNTYSPQPLQAYTCPVLP